MEKNEMLDRLFGPPAPQTWEGKFEKNKCLIIIMACIVGASIIIMGVSKKKISIQPKEKEEDKIVF